MDTYETTQIKLMKQSGTNIQRLNQNI